MITMIRKYLFCHNMKNEVAKHLAICIECEQVKVEHQHLVGLLQPLPIPQWKWETIRMDFITFLPKNVKQNDSIIVLVDKLSKETHFSPIKST